MVGIEDLSNFVLNFGTGYEGELLNLGVYTLGIFVYGLMVWYLYEKISKRDIVAFEQSVGNSAITDFVYAGGYSVLFSTLAFLWFLAMSGLLFVLSKGQSVDGILLTSATLVASTRLTSYFHEKLAEDFAKLIPLVFLGVFIIDPTVFSVSLVFQRFGEAITLLPLIARYWVFIVAMELVLRFLHWIYAGLKGVPSVRKSKKEDD